MTSTLSIFLGLLIVGGILTDIVLTGGDNLVFLARRFADLTEWMAFWR